jgi:hypothetical protein
MLKINEDGKIEIYNVIPVFRDNRIIKFVTSVSIADINKVKNKLVYDEQTQRGFKDVKNKKGDIIKQQQIFNKHNVDEITMKIVNHLFIDGSMLSWCCRLDNIEDKDSYSYFPEEMMVRINKDFLSVPDSSQRHLAIYNLENYNLSINPETFYFPIQVCLYTLKEEQSFFSEVNSLGSRASLTRSLYLSNTFKTLLVKGIISESKLRNNVETKKNVTVYTDKVTSFATLYNSFFEHGKGAFRDLREDDVDKFKEWIIKFYNYLIEVRPELTILTKEERMKLKKESIIDTAVTVYAFAFIAKALWHDTNWKRKIQKLAHPYKCGLWEGDIFSISNPKLMGTVCLQTVKGEWKVNNSRRSVDFIVDMLLKYLNLIKL